MPAARNWRESRIMEKMAQPFRLYTREQGAAVCHWGRVRKTEECRRMQGA